MPRSALIAAAVAAAIAAAPAVAHADTDYFAHSGESSTVKVRHNKSRTVGQRAIIWGLIGGAAVSLGIGVYYNFDSKKAADEVQAQHDQIIGIWSDDRQATFDRAHSSGVVAIVGYSIAGACAAGAIVATLLTHPGEEVQELKPGTSVSLVHGGAVVSRTWSWR